MQRAYAGLLFLRRLRESLVTFMPNTITLETVMMRFAVRVTGAYGVDGLRQVTADHADSGNVADYVYKQCVCHRI